LFLTIGQLVSGKSWELKKYNRSGARQSKNRSSGSKNQKNYINCANGQESALKKTLPSSTSELELEPARPNMEQETCSARISDQMTTKDAKSIVEPQGTRDGSNRLLLTTSLHSSQVFKPIMPITGRNLNISDFVKNYFQKSDVIEKHWRRLPHYTGIGTIMYQEIGEKYHERKLLIDKNHKLE